MASSAPSPKGALELNPSTIHRTMWKHLKTMDYLAFIDNVVIFLGLFTGTHAAFDPQVARAARIDDLSLPSDTRASKDLELIQYQRWPEWRFRVQPRGKHFEPLKPFSAKT